MVIVAAFLAVALAGGTGALAVFATGFATGVTVVFILAVLMDAAGVPEAGAVDAVEVATVDCCTVPLTGDIDVTADVPALGATGAQGAAPVVFGAAGAGAAFFFPKSDPRLEKAAVAFETAVLAVAGT